MVEWFTLVSFGLLVLMNLVFVVKNSIQGCKDKKALKALEARKKVYEETMKERKEKKEH